MNEPQMALDFVAEFAQRDPSVSEVWYSICNNELTFIFVQKNNSFDWDLCDRLTELEYLLLERCTSIATNCLNAPCGANIEFMGRFENPVQLDIMNKDI